MSSRTLLLIMVLGAVALLVTPFPPTSGGGVAHVRPEGTSTLPGASLAQLLSTATQPFYRVQTFWQNNSGVYGGSSTKAFFPVNFSATATYSSVQGASLTATVTTGIGYTAQVNLTQGATLIANGTAPLPFTVPFNATSGVSILDRTVEIYAPGTGALPTSGHTYGVFTNATEAISYTYLNAISWVYNSTAYATNYSFSSPDGYTLNNTQLFIPFPSGVYPDVTTVAVTLNGAIVTNEQATSGGVFYSPPNLAKGKTDYVFVTVRPLPNLGGSAPTITLTSYARYNTTFNVANGSWVNTGTLAYFGEYVIQAPTFPFAFSGGSTNLYANGILLSRTAYQVSGTTIVVNGLVLNTPVAAVASFTLYFQFVGAPPSLDIVRSSTWIAGGGFTVTWGSLMLFLAFGVPVAIVIAGAAAPAPRTMEAFFLAPRIDRRYVYLAGVAAVLFLGIYIAMPP